MPRDLRALPKANLHLHLTGSMRPSTAAELAAHYDLPPLPAVPIEPGVVHGWDAFQARYDTARAAVRSSDDIARVVREAVEQDGADGVGWTELQVDPTAYAGWLGSLEAVVEALLDAARDLPVGVILAASWGADPEHAERIARIAVKYAPEGVLGFGLSNDERRGQVRAFVPAFRLVAEAGLARVPHAGFYAGAWHVRECVELLGATRIGHGLTAIQDPSVVALLAERQVALEVCPTSYPPFGVTPAPEVLPALLADGVPVALATDDPLLFGVGMVGQYEVARQVCSDAGLAAIAATSVRASNAPDLLKRRLLDGIQSWLGE
ncbi:adenosine deaminase [Promicromonospora sp. Populi]|uniref:adenosine deaminase n=1 Tax=Promicromonospora sp. Populi TaxID=3239420 RepID=UPI0034E25BB1